MKYWKCAGLCAAGFLLEAAISAALSLLVFYMFVFCLLITIPTCILIGKAHYFIARKIRGELGIRPAAYYIAAMALPVVTAAALTLITLFYPDLLTRGTVSSLSEGFAGLARFIIIAGTAVNSLICTLSGVHFINRSENDEPKS